MDYYVRVVQKVVCGTIDIRILEDVTNFIKGRLQKTSAKISDFQNTPCPGVSE